MVCLVMGVLPAAILFMVALCIALVVNYPDLDMQKRLVGNHSASALAVVGIIFAAGIFTGILSGTGMVEAMSQKLVAIIPESMGPCLAPITAVIHMPLTFFLCRMMPSLCVYCLYSLKLLDTMVSLLWKWLVHWIVGQPVTCCLHWFHRLTYSVDWQELTLVNTKNLPSNGQ